MTNALKAFPEEKRGPVPDGLIVDGNNFYFTEFPPGQAVTRVGLQEKDTLGDFLNNLTSGGKPAN